MAKYEFKLPDIGEGVVEGEIVTWHVEVGSIVKEDDALVDVTTAGTACSTLVRCVL